MDDQLKDMTIATTKIQRKRKRRTNNLASGGGGGGLPVFEIINIIENLVDLVAIFTS